MKKKLNKGFTLVELIVVIAIVAILAAVSVVGFSAFIDSAKKSRSNQEAEQIKMAVHEESILNVSFDFEIKDSAATPNIIPPTAKIQNSSTGIRVSQVTGGGVFTAELAAQVLVCLFAKANSTSTLTEVPTDYAYATSIPSLATKPTIVVLNENDDYYLNNPIQKVIKGFTYISLDNMQSDFMSLI